MATKSAEEICCLFQRYIREADISAVLALYDPDIVVLNQLGEARRGLNQLREELEPLASAKSP